MFLNSVLNVWDIFQRFSGVDVCNETVLIWRFIGASDLIGAMLVQGHESRNAASRSHKGVLRTNVVIIRKRGVCTRFERVSSLVTVIPSSFVIRASSFSLRAHGHAGGAFEFAPADPCAFNRAQDRFP